MGFPLEKTPPSVKIRLLYKDNLFHVMKRVGESGEEWQSIGQFKTRNKAIDFLEAQPEFPPNEPKVTLIDKLRRWALDVKRRAGWVCEEPGCGELDKEVLDAHHPKPRSEFPELTLDPENGKCVCLFDHAWRHRDNIRIMEHILARLALILYQRLYPRRIKQIKEMKKLIMAR